MLINGNYCSLFGLCGLLITEKSSPTNFSCFLNPNHAVLVHVLTIELSTWCHAFVGK